MIENVNVIHLHRRRAREEVNTQGDVESDNGAEQPAGDDQSALNQAAISSLGSSQQLSRDSFVAEVLNEPVESCADFKPGGEVCDQVVGDVNLLGPPQACACNHARD